MFILYILEIFQISHDKTKHMLLFFFNPRCRAAQLTPYCTAKIGIILEMTKKKVKKVKLVRKIHSFCLRQQRISAGFHTVNKKKLCRLCHIRLIPLNIKEVREARFDKNCAATVPQPCR